MTNPIKSLLTGLLLCTNIMVACLLTSSNATADGNSEYKVKAALVLNIARFTTWPDSGENEQSNSLRLCVFGNESVQQEFSSLDNKKLGQRVFTVSPMKNPMEAGQCELVFYSGNDRKTLPRLFSAVENNSTLTIGEMGGFTQLGGIINLVKKNKRIQFELNPLNVNKAGLVISSRLMKLCTIIEE